MSTRRTSLRRRLDNLGLRIQARVDAAWADRMVPYASAAVLFMVLVAVASATVRQLDGGSGLGVWRQAAWMVRNGLTAETSLSGANPVLDDGSFVAFPVMWATAVVPAPALFTLVQASALSVVVIPLWRFCRDEIALRIGATCAVIVAYGLAPVMHAANLSAFRPEVIAVPAVFGALLAARRKRWFMFGLALALVLLCRADLGLTVAAIGALVITDGHRRQGLVAVGAGLLWSLAAVLILQPVLPDGPLTSAEIAGAHNSAPLAALRSLFVEPTQVFSDFFDSSGIDVVLTLLGPLLFLPLVATRHVVAALPAVVLGIAGAEGLAELAVPGAPMDGRPGGQVVVALPFVFVAAVIALGNIGRRSLSRVNVDHRIVAALLCGSLLFFVNAAPSSPYERPWRWGGRDAVDSARLEAVTRIPETASIVTSPQLTELVAERMNAGQLPFGPPPRASTRGFDAVILDTTGKTQEGLDLWTDEDRQSVLDHLGEQGFNLRFQANGILAFTR